MLKVALLFKLILIITTTHFSLSLLTQDFNINIQHLAVGLSANYTLNDKLEYVIFIDNLTHDLGINPPRVQLSCPDCEKTMPLLVAIRQREGILSWELPLVFSTEDNKYELHQTERTFCPFDIINPKLSNKPFFTKNVADPTLSLSLTTASPKNVTAFLKCDLELDFVLSLNKQKNFFVSPSTPRYMVFNFNDTSADYVLLHVTSPDSICMTVSVQHIQCPVNDLESNVQNVGHWQSVTGSSGITIKRNDFPQGFYAVFVVHSNDHECSRSFLQWAQQNRTKQVGVIVKDGLDNKGYIIAIFASSAFLFIFCAVMSILMLCYLKKVQMLYPQCIIADKPDDPSAIASMSQSMQDTTQSDSHVSQSGDDDSDTNSLPDQIFVRSEGLIYVCELSRKNPSTLRKKSDLYLWYLITVAIFYFLPVVQLVVTYQRVVNLTGNENLCYYNFLCSKPLGLLSDFNHVFSNSGYVIMGSLFFCITYYRHLIHRRMVFRNKNIDKNFGIPQHFGLFYAMAAALIVEGILSACYHVCPNSYNFQFDTSFMYVISTICMLKLYHSRHPDISATACATFATLAGAILFGMCGVLSGTPSFWSIFTAMHLVACFFLSIQIYYLGQWRFEFAGIKRIFTNLYDNIREKRFRAILPTFVSRFIVIFIANIVNWALAILGPMYLLGPFATYLLIIFMVNLILYTCFYIIMKIHYKEKIGPIPAILIIVSGLCWTVSMYFFVNKSISWKLTPAESKLFNRECLIMDFYDNHDIWHFLSASSMFFSFMVLLTLDDGLLNVRRDQISVF